MDRKVREMEYAYGHPWKEYATDEQLNFLKIWNDGLLRLNGTHFQPSGTWSDDTSMRGCVK